MSQSILIRTRSGPKGTVVVDDDDFAQVQRHRWHIDGAGYVFRVMPPGVHPCVTMLHRELCGLESGDGLEVDHRDGNPLNCCRSNMRVVTHKQNTQNVPSRPNSASRHRNVHWESSTGKWRVQVVVDGRKIRSRRFVSEDEAASVAREYRRLYFTHSNEERCI